MATVIKSHFGTALLKKEGDMIRLFSGEPVPPADPNAVKWTYVERSVPVALEEKCHELIDAFLKEHGHHE